MKKLLCKITIVSVLLCGVLSSCVDPTFTHNPEHKITLSKDTIMLDTIFTTQHSSTYRLMLYNKTRYAIKIDEILLAGGSESHFRFNADGVIADADNRVHDLTLYAHDSLYVLIECTSPEIDSQVLAHEDSLIILYNSNCLKVQLFAPTRNAHIVYNGVYQGDNTLVTDLPYLVIGYMYVPEESTLTIPQGVEIFMHAGANIIVDGTLNINGSLNYPVKIRGDRYDKINDVHSTPYAWKSGQWGGIYLQNAASHHSINYLNMEGATVGVLLLGAARATPSLKCTNSRIHNSRMYGIYSQQASVEIANTELSNCGTACLSLIGGNAQVVHTTIADYISASRKTPALQIINYVKQYGTVYTFPITKAVIENSIIYGSLSNEVALERDSIYDTDFNVLISNCLVKGKQQLSPYFANCIWGRTSSSYSQPDSVFVSSSIQYDSDTTIYYNFELAPYSKARDCANKGVAMQYPYDKHGVSRLTDAAPDLGAYEYVEK